MVVKSRMMLGAAALAVVVVGAGAVYLEIPRADPFAGCGGRSVASRRATIGGPFEMTDAVTGARVTDVQVFDKPTLIYFGYTYCPDVCPTDLATISRATDLLDARGLTVKPVFSTIDPERDNAEAVSGFISAFNPRMEGLTGSADDVAKIARAFRVYYARNPNDDYPDGYLMDHSTFTYLMAPGGRYLTYFSHGTSAEDIAKGAACYISALND